MIKYDQYQYHYHTLNNCKLNCLMVLRNWQDMYYENDLEDVLLMMNHEDDFDSLQKE